MKSQMKKLNKFAKGMSKVFEVLFWIGDLSMLVILIAIAFAKDKIINAIQGGLDSESLTIAQNNFQVIDMNGQLVTSALVLAIIGGIIILGLIAMIFRNVYLIFKKSETESPFAKDNIRMVREIGIFSIAIPVAEFVISLIALIIGGGVVNVSVNPFAIVFGIIMLCLSQFFAYGAYLEHNVEGLV